MDNLYNQTVNDINNVLGKRFLNTKSLYLHHFKTLPNVHYVSMIDGEKAFTAFNEHFSGLITTVHQYRWFKHEKKKFEFDTTIVLLNNRFLIEFDDDYCQLLHDGTNEGFIDEVVALLKKFKERKKKDPLEINLVVNESYGLDLKPMEIKKTKLDIGLFYEDDFAAIDATIQERLNKKNDKGIVLLHGLPGTGKTTYLRYLIGRIKKRVLFLSPNVAGNLMNPDFIDLLIDNPNTVMIIEDAENIIMDRRNSNSSSVSSLLNISDGLLADFLNVQLVCTFNSPLTLIDNALLRKGRLIARYEFGKLSIPKAQKLSNHFKFDSTITKPMTVAEISNQHEQTFESKQVNVIGFRRHEMEVANN